MGELKNISKYKQVKSLVSQGITSPSIIIKQIPEIKNWRTAKKHINQAILELNEDSQTDRKNEYYSLVNNVKFVKDQLQLKLNSAKDINHIIGLSKQILTASKLLADLMGLSSQKIDINIDDKNKKNDTTIELINKSIELWRLKQTFNNSNDH